MIAQVSEKKIHSVRWLLAVGWLILILSLFYDPISPWLTNPSHPISPIHLHPEKYLNPLSCVKVQGVCQPQQPYALGVRIFWAMIVPISIIILLVFGHEFWRRICPLYFFSQIPRALGIQRLGKIVNPNTDNGRYELASVDNKSWLGRNYLYLQFSLLYLGLNIRILFVNSDRLALGLFLLFTIASAITVGFLFKGRSWCQYFCPMAPVEILYTGPRGLLGSDAHLKSPTSITQSTCRTVNSSGKEKSACVSCQSPCIDIDAERSYWEGITRADQKLVFYGYFGLMVGFYFFYKLYSGNWEYYFSGVWTYEVGLHTLFNPGFYIFERAIPIPKLVAAPLTLAVFTAASYFSFELLEKAYRSYLQRQNKYINEEQVLHVLFVLCTFISFNVFFLFNGYSILNSLPHWVILIFNTLMAVFSSTWLYRSLKRSKERYFRESLVSSLRRQLNKLEVDWSNLLEGRSLQDLLPDEVYVLGKVLPNFYARDRVQKTASILLAQLQDMVVGERMLYDLMPNPQASVYLLLLKAVQQKEKLIITELLGILEMLRESPEAFKIASSISTLAANAIAQILDSERSRWQECLDPRIITSLQQTQNLLTQPVLLSTQLRYATKTPEALIDLLLLLLQDLDPVVQAASLYILHQLNPLIGFQQASQVLDVKPNKNWLLQKTAQKIIGLPQDQNQPINVPTMIAQIKAMNSTQRLVFQQLTIRVGRGNENDIVILDDRIHEQHAIFSLDDKGVTVQDLGNTQGLRIGRDYIHNQRKQLKPIDIIRFSNGDDLLILVQWKMQPLQKDTITGSLRTLEASVIHKLLAEPN